MGTQPVLDLEALLSRIDEGAPCGTDPRLDPSPVSLYQTLKDARHAAADAERNIERGFDEASDAKQAEQTARKSWELILAQGPELISRVAKDLEVVAWLIEALVRTRQLAGLRDGLQLMTGLIERYWNGLFPLPDEDGLETRLLPIAGLSGGEVEGRLVIPLKKVPLTEGDEPAPFSFWHYESAAEGSVGGAATIAAFTTSLQHSSDDFVRNLADDAQASLAALDQFTAALTTRCADETPSFSRVREVLSGILGALKPHSGLALAAPPPPVVEDALASAVRPVEYGREMPLDRQSALRQLEALATFFRSTEPNSPTAYAIDNLVRRARMTFSELVEELIDDSSARRSYLIHAGIQPPPDGSKGS